MPKVEPEGDLKWARPPPPPPLFLICCPLLCCCCCSSSLLSSFWLARRKQQPLCVLQKQKRISLLMNLCHDPPPPPTLTHNTPLRQTHLPCAENLNLSTCLYLFFSSCFFSSLSCLASSGFGPEKSLNLAKETFMHLKISILVTKEFYTILYSSLMHNSLAAGFLLYYNLKRNRKMQLTIGKYLCKHILFIVISLIDYKM